MIYSVVYQRFSEVTKNLSLVEDHIEAAGFEVTDGCVVFVNADGQPFKAIPRGAWVGVDPAPETTNTLVV